MHAVYRKNGWPDANTEYLYYQILIGAWPVTLERILGYMQKAVREAKQHTSWTQNNDAYEEQLKQFIRITLAGEEFVAEIESFVKMIDGAGRINSLAQTLLKCTAPGVPDLYQGSELWDHRLVDPDNRGPVDFEERKRLLLELQGLSVEEILKRRDSGMPKLWTIQQALRVRRKYAECFDVHGNYTPVIAKGRKSDHVVAFLRGDRVATIVRRFSLGVTDGWGDTALVLPSGRWKNELTGDEAIGGEMRAKTVFSRFPVALFTKMD
jgi:(1->4)-alpha-D-glucan 1-alpha-D-glucosylmutase